MKKKYVYTFIFSFLLLASITIVIVLLNNNKSENYSGEPTVFVHGYKGTLKSFGNMLDRFETKYNWGTKALIYYVTSDGEVNEYNFNKGRDKPAFIQVLFEDNRAGFSNSAEWLATALKKMKKDYSIDSVDLVGHSMGGIVSLKYAKQYQQEEYPSVNKIVAIGSPFDGIYKDEYFQINRDAAATDLKPDSAELQLLQVGTFPTNVEVLNIGSTGDPVAVPESVEAIRTVISSDQLVEIIIEDDNLGHSALHENEQVDKLIYSFLWQDEFQ
ncbi:alpha/beta fold hydrolase [Virgibacillus sp. C22-A2]|uniref:Alpha/beta fold hydrolase n=1 Tax=Virgibacillus tibetensis TaxID=3042313 RepID=A0ABU6KH47_9BACI|nr:alpha/beta fold hydrolase [Virgibacillus sp. C22-A2]